MVLMQMIINRTIANFRVKIACHHGGFEFAGPWSESVWGTIFWTKAKSLSLTT